MNLAVGRSAKIIVASAILLSTAVPVAAQEFFKGKTVVVLVGTAAGGGFDTYSRTMARHLGKHLPGNPTIVVQNMPGAGQLIAANHLYNRSAPDGLTIGHFSGSVIFHQCWAIKVRCSTVENLAGSAPQRRNATPAWSRKMPA